MAVISSSQLKISNEKKKIKHLRIGIDATGLGSGKTGTVVYATEILAKWNENKSIPHRFYIFTNPSAKKFFVSLELDHRFSVVDSPRNRYVRSIWQQIKLPFLLRRLKIDVHWGTGFTVPILSRTKLVVTIHDLTFYLLPSVHERLKRYLFPLLIRLGVNKSQHVIAVSKTTALDLFKLSFGARNKTSVVYPAGRDIGRSVSSLADRNYKISEVKNFILFVGTIEPRKNLERLLDAWHLIPDNVKADVKLIIVGNKGWMSESVEKKMELSSDVPNIGAIDDSALKFWLSRAMFLVYPSIYEGFGLPVVEAMSAGIPVLTSNVSSMKEVAGEAAYLVNPYSVDEIKIGMIRLLTDKVLRSELTKSGLHRGSQFSWTTASSKTLQILEQAATAT